MAAAGANWHLQKIVDSGIDQDEALICPPVDGCDYELGPYPSSGSGSERRKGHACGAEQL